MTTSPWLPSGWALEGHQLRSPVKLKAAQAVGKNKMRVPKCMPLPDLQLDNPSLSISTKWKATAGHSTPPNKKQEKPQENHCRKNIELY